MKYFIIHLLFLACFSWAQTQLAHPTTQLQKLSRSLRGKNADINDLKNIQSMNDTLQIENFLKSKAKEYIKTDNFKMNFKFKIDELFKMNVVINQYREDKQNEAYDNLIQSLVSENQSWDQLLLAREFKISLPEDGFPQDQYDGSEQKFYEVLTGGKDYIVDDFAKVITAIPNQSQRKMVPTTYTFDEGDERIAGLLSTPRFYSRYTNTALNKNRRRAAFLFEAFLCDPMVPVVPSINKENELKDIDFSVGKDVTEEQIKAHAKLDPHGTQKDCMACHEKLDPMGQVFSSSNFRLSPFASPGALFYRRSGAAPVSIPVKGVRSLAKSIINQEEYVKCQTQHFWNWFIGEDVPLSESRQEQIVKNFNSVQRKPVDFILYLVSQPEFKKAPKPLTEDQLLARQAVQILKTCHSCHRQNESEMIDYWDMSVLPFAKDLKTRINRITELKKQLDTQNNSHSPKMPPRSSLWRPTPQEYSVLNQWLKKGAPDLNGVLQVERDKK